MDLEAAKAQRHGLQKELEEIRLHDSKFNLHYMMAFLNSEIQHLDEYIAKASLKDITYQSEIRIPTEYEAFIAASTEGFIRMTNAELRQLMTLAKPFPFTVQFIQKVIDRAEVLLVKQKQKENQVFGGSDDQTGTKRKRDATFGSRSTKNM